MAQHLCTSVTSMGSVVLVALLSVLACSLATNVFLWTRGADVCSHQAQPESRAVSPETWRGRVGQVGVGGQGEVEASRVSGGGVGG